MGDCPTMCVFMLDTSVAPFIFENTADLMDGATGLDLTAGRGAARRRARQQPGAGVQHAGGLHAGRRRPARAAQDRAHPAGAGQGPPDQPGRPRPHAGRVLRGPRLDAATACPRGPSSRSSAWATPPTGWASRDHGPRADDRPAEVADQAGGVRRRAARRRTVADLLARLAATYGGAGRGAPDRARRRRAPIRRCASWSTGATSACSADRATVLAEGDDMLVLTPIAGG